MKMKKSLLVAVAALSMSSLSGCAFLDFFKKKSAEPETPQEEEPQDTTVHVSSITVGEASISVTLGDRMKLQAEVVPANATNKKLLWSSNNTSVVTVDQDGNIEALALGEASITVQSEDNLALVKTFTVKVLEDVIHVTGISLDREVLDINTNDAPVRLVATVTPADASNKSVQWKSSDSNVATVAPDGTVTPVAGGNALITAETNDGGYKASCSVNVIPVHIETLRVGFPIERNASYKAFLNNIKPNTANPFGEYKDRTQPYEIGDDNKFSFKPVFTVRDAAQGGEEVDQSLWSYPFEIKVEKKVGSEYQLASASDYDVVSRYTCDLRFNTTAVGSEYKVSVQIGGLDADQLAEVGIANATAVYDVKVVDGYNVTEEIELLYLDTAPDNTYEMGSGEDEFHPDYPAFKRAKGLNATYSPVTLVLHKDMRVKPEHLPEELFYTAAYAEEQGWSQADKDAAIGTLKDYTYLYSKWSTGKTTLSGNYFTIDWSGIPLIKRARGHSVLTDEKVESHSSFMRLYNGEYEIKNINFIGNASVAEGEDETVRAGGLIGFKSTWANSVLDMNNTLGHGCYITVFAEAAWSTLGDGRVAEVNVRNSKLYDNYNSFFYNWGGHLTVEDSIIEGCGGPVVIQDHWDNTWGNDTIHEFYAFEYDPQSNPLHYSYRTYGYVPETTFIDSDIRNYVIGSEAWFVSFEATEVTASIKAMGDMLPAISPTRSMVFDANHQASTYLGLSAAGQDSFFNFIVLNKSAHIEGMSNEQVNGVVKFLHRDGGNLVEVDNFDYFAPLPAENADADATYLPALQRYYKFRMLANAGAPIFHTAGGSAFWPGAGTDLFEVSIDANPYYNPNPQGGAPEVVDSSLVTGAHDNVALYYNGMMLVMGLGTFGA